MAKPSSGRVITKKHLARLERERLQTRYIMIGSIVVVALVIILIGYGVTNEYILKPLKPVAEVAGDKISTSEFQANVRYQRDRLVRNYLQLVQYFGEDATFRQQAESQLSYPQVIGQQVIYSLVQDRIIRQEAARRGIKVSKEEIDAAIQDDFGYYPNGTPIPTGTLAPAATSTLSALQMTLSAPTATATPTTTLATPTTTPTLVPSPTIDPNQPTNTPGPTETPYTKDSFQSNYKEYSGDLKTRLNITESDLRRIYESRLLGQKVMDAVLNDLGVTKSEEEQVWARHILVSDEVTATQVLQALNNGGDFAQLAAEYSTDTSNKNRGGDLGWFGKGRMVAEFEQAAWTLQVGEIVSQPVKTSFGYHIIQVLGHEIRPLRSSEFETLRQQRFSDWLDEQRKAMEADGKVKVYDDWTAIVPSDPALPAAQATEVPIVETALP